MQSVRWYIQRLQAMTPAELAWRLRATARDWKDRAVLKFGGGMPCLQDIQSAGPAAPGFRCPGLGGPVPGFVRPSVAADGLLARSEAIASHRFSFFDLIDCPVGHPVRWNYEHRAARMTPMKFAPSIDYRNYAETGDCKNVWEINRHHHLVVLARAWRHRGERRFADEVVAQIDSWIEQCPYGYGMNWRSPLELGIRLINWVWAVDLIEPSGAITPRFRDRLIRSVHQHLHEIARKYSRGSSANNHLIGEAAGVFIAASYFVELRQAAAWAAESREILEREIFAQSYPDGCTREHAFGYQLFVMEFFLYAALTARACGRPFSDRYLGRLKNMFAFVAAMSEGGPLPMVGDGDDGYVLDLGDPARRVAELLAAGGVLWNEGGWIGRDGAAGEAVQWLFGPASETSLRPAGAEPRMCSRAFADSGYYLLQASGGARQRLSVLVDCAELGMGGIAAHGHADALGIVLRLNGHEVLTDPGTYDYFTHPDWRRYFRSTRAHNTAVVDEADQSVMQGPFMWGRRATARCLAWAPDAEPARFVGQHDGYCMLSDPVVHRRSLSLDGAGASLRILDEFTAAGPHRIALYFHFAETCRVTEEPGRLVRVESPGGVVWMRFDERLSLELVQAGGPDQGGWVSRGYHRRAASVTLAARAHTSGNAAFETCVSVEPAGEKRGRSDEADRESSPRTPVGLTSDRNGDGPSGARARGKEALWRGS